MKSHKARIVPTEPTTKPAMMVITFLMSATELLSPFEEDPD